MISCLILERFGRWRTLGLIAALGLCAAPTLPLIIQAGFELENIGSVFTGAFVRSVTNSGFIALLVGVTSYVIGLPLGVIPAVFQVRGHKALVGMLALPLLLPSFLVAIGWSSLSARVGGPVHSFINGPGGCLLVFSTTGIPLAMLTAYSACTSLTSSQLDAARLAGGARPLMEQVLRFASTPAMFAAVLTSILSVSDPGPGQIFGVSTAGSEILTSIAATYDFTLAAQQCLVLVLLVLLIAGPLIWAATPTFTSAVLARQTRQLRQVQHSQMEVVGLSGLMIAPLVLLACPLLGLILPLGEGAGIGRAAEELRRTAWNTLAYGLGAGLLSVSVGFAIAFFVGRNRQILRLAIAALAILFVLPPSLGALGILHLRSFLPMQFDPWFNSRFVVGTELALRFVPVAAILMLRSWGATSPTWAMAGAVHGVPFTRYFRRILMPWMIRSVVLAGLIVGLLATSDIVTVLLLQPPGESSFPLAIFTVMANAPESLVASMCLLYVAGAAALLIGFAVLAPSRRR